MEPLDILTPLNLAFLQLRYKENLNNRAVLTCITLQIKYTILQDDNFSIP